MISCKEAVGQLWSYLDRNLGLVPEAEIEEHLGLCRHCCGELEFARQVRERLRHEGPALEISDDARHRLETFLKDVEG